MSSLTRKHGICLILVAFIFSLVGSALHAVTKHEIFELSRQIKAKKAEIASLQAELRKLNEEGGPDAQEKAQIIMEQIRELREQLNELNKNLEKLKKTSNNAIDATESFRRR
ncbi:MAG: hypothetical protein PHD82_04240 [Candidatus Riflebacteria bacterium]|jgi:prefoldin subunit 5|nr:hypothetical protein [Candidatus Riflebacteria bacterium]